MLTTRQAAQAAAVGVGATMVMDAAAAILRRRGIPSLDYALLGRWIGHMPRGAFTHRSIMAADPVPHEKELGWAAHYAIGTGFAIVMVAVRPSWLERPTLAPAMATGVATTAAPWLCMQPAFGLGVAASKAPDPTRARISSLRAHAIYGAGLWASGRVLHALLH
ncbi:MAG: DUF2938 family protein [Actinomyces bowdenii]|nr:DUF2938 family protein [Actinomyces bowdenii]